jgi:hypothetical protein
MEVAADLRGTIKKEKEEVTTPWFQPAHYFDQLKEGTA